MILCLYINTLDGTGGTERATVLLANYLADQNWQVYILCKQGGTKSFYNVSDKVTIKYLHESTNINIYKNYIKTLIRYRNFINKAKPDYIIDIGVNLALETHPASFMKKTRVISWEHFNANVYHNYIINSISKWMAASLSKRIVVLTDQDKEVYQNKFSAKKVSVIPYPVAIDVKGHQYNENSRQVLTIGRYTNQKGLDYLLDAWKIVQNKHSDWKLKIVGEGELHSVLLAQCNSLGLDKSVEFIAPSPDVVQHFRQTSIYAMSSRYEGLPLVLIEAKCFGLPIVSFDCETGPRQIIRDNVDGLLIPVNNPTLLAEGIITLIESPSKRKEFNNNALADSVRFSPQEFYKKWENILSEN
jgi:glycosyltransferase involved in cell wall biosynthesis